MWHNRGKVHQPTQYIELKIVQEDTRFGLRSESKTHITGQTISNKPVYLMPVRQPHIPLDFIIGNRVPAVTWWYATLIDTPSILVVDVDAGGQHSSAIMKCSTFKLWNETHMICANIRTHTMILTQCGADVIITKTWNNAEASVFCIQNCHEWIWLSDTFLTSIKRSAVARNALEEAGISWTNWRKEVISSGSDGKMWKSDMSEKLWVCVEICRVPEDKI